LVATRRHAERAPFAASRPALDRSLDQVRPPHSEMTVPAKRVPSGELLVPWTTQNASTASGDLGETRLGPWPPSLRGYAIFYQGGDLAASVQRTRRGAPVITWPTTEPAASLEVDHER
jgi:hypothetical protein